MGVSWSEQIQWRQPSEGADKVFAVKAKKGGTTPANLTKWKSRNRKFANELMQPSKTGREMTKEELEKYPVQCLGSQEVGVRRLEEYGNVQG